MTTPRLLGFALALLVTAAAAHAAPVLCQKRTGQLSLREGACKKRETAVTIPADAIADGAIGAAKIAEGAIGAGKLAAGAVGPAHLAGMPTVVAFMGSGTFFVPEGEHTNLPFTTESIDTDAMHDPVNVPELLVAPVAGLYLIQCEASLDVAPGATVIDMVIRKRLAQNDNAASWSRVAVAAGESSVVSTAAMVQLDAGQGTLMSLKHDGAGPVELFGAGCTMTWLTAVPGDV